MHIQIATLKIPGVNLNAESNPPEINKRASNNGPLSRDGGGPSQYNPNSSQYDTGAGQNYDPYINDHDRRPVGGGGGRARAPPEEGNEADPNSHDRDIYDTEDGKDSGRGRLDDEYDDDSRGLLSGGTGQGSLSPRSGPAINKFPPGQHPLEGVPNMDFDSLPEPEEFTAKTK